MKIVLFLIVSVLAMAEIKVPYPYPDYDSDLIAKEIINGTYIASINMMIKNSKTGEERYVHVPDSRIEDRIVSNEQGNVREPDIDVNMSIEDRDKLLEKSLLPKRVQVKDDEPTIISRAMCPQGLEFVKEEYFGLIKENNTEHFTIYNDGTNKNLVLYKSRNDENNNVIHEVYKYDGATLIKIFDMPKIANPKDEQSLLQLYVVGFIKIGDSNFIVSLNHLLEYNLNGIVSITYFNGTQFYGNEQGFSNDGNRYIASAPVFGLQIVNIDTLETTVQMQDVRYGTLPKIYKSIADNKYFIIDNYLLMMNDGIVSIKNRVSSDRELTELYAIKNSRYDYYSVGNKELGVNIKKGIVAPRIQSKLTTEDTEMFIGTMINNIDLSNVVRHIAYSPNYVNIVDTGIEADTLLTYNDEYAYFKKDENIIVMKITEWAYKIPRAEYAEQFAKEGMLDAIWWRSHDKPNIGE